VRLRDADRSWFTSSSDNSQNPAFTDLLFYHTRLKRYVVVELKAGAFKPEHAGQLNFYLAAVDAQMKAPDDNPTIGLLLCKTKNRLVAEYALSGMAKPMGVAEQPRGPRDLEPPPSPLAPPARRTQPRPLGPRGLGLLMEPYQVRDGAHCGVTSQSTCASIILAPCSAWA
jgi:hypothetical protein